MPIHAVDSIALDIYAPIYAVPSPCALIDVYFCRFCGVEGFGFWPFHILLVTDDDLINILETSSTMVTSLIGKSLSLKISTVSRMPCMPQQYPIRF